MEETFFSVSEPEGNMDHNNQPKTLLASWPFLLGASKMEHLNPKASRGLHIRFVEYPKPKTDGTGRENTCPVVKPHPQTWTIELYAVQIWNPTIGFCPIEFGTDLALEMKFKKFKRTLIYLRLHYKHYTPYS